MTRWAALVDTNAPLPEYPRPQLVRSNWLNLNGLWQFQVGAAKDPVPIGQTLSNQILVATPTGATSALDVGTLYDGYLNEVLSDKLANNNSGAYNNSGLNAAVYTQITDVENECDGLITYDREVLKPDTNQILVANEIVISGQYDNGILTANTLTLPTDYMGYWPLDATNGTVAIDASGNGNNGTVTGATWNPNGKINGCLSFGGTNNYVRISNTISGDFSITFWVKTTQTGGTGQWYKRDWWTGIRRSTRMILGRRYLGGTLPSGWATRIQR